jgi:hypothetical protein
MKTATALALATRLDQLAVEPNPVKIATEGAMWGAIRHHGFSCRRRDRLG